MYRGSNLLRLADYNQAVVLDLIRRSPGLSRADLQRTSGLASQTISNITRRLIEAELITESAPPLETGRGRPSIPLTVNGPGAFAIGVHIDPARLTLLLVDVSGRVHRRQQLRTPQATNPGEVTALVAVSAGRLIREAGVERDRVLGVGIAAPGPIDVQAGVVVDPPQLPNWRNVRLRSDLHDATGLPVLLDKDVTAAATAALRSTSGRDFLFLYLGSGVGASVVADGQVLRGASNNIGEVGDLIVDPDAEDLGWSGRRGGLAAACVAEALAIQAAAAGVIERPDLSDYLAIDDACTELSAAAAGGDAAAVELLQRAGRRIAAGIGTLVNFIDVPRVVMGGPLWRRLSPTVLPVLRASIAAELVVSRPDLTIESSPVGDDVAAHGAAELVLDHYLAPRPSALMVS